MSNRMYCPEGVKPRDWPRHWTFPPYAMPPGWPRKQKRSEHLLCEAFSAREFVVRVRNEYEENDDALNGELIHVRAYDNDKKIRLRPNDGGRWYDDAVFPVRRILKDNFGIAVELFFDLKRVHPKSEVLMVLFDVYGLTPRVGCGLPLLVSELRK